jgi:uncharacterized protein with HEPN domain
LPSSRPAERYGDIIANIDAIRRYTAGMDEARYLADAKTQDATIACFIRIGEAVAKLGDLAAQLTPDQPWGEMRGLANKLRHEYDRIQPEILWRTIASDVDSLRAACERAIQVLAAVAKGEAP